MPARPLALRNQDETPIGGRTRPVSCVLIESRSEGRGAKPTGVRPIGASGTRAAGPAAVGSTGIGAEAPSAVAGVVPGIEGMPLRMSSERIGPRPTGPCELGSGVARGAWASADEPASIIRIEAASPAASRRWSIRSLRAGIPRGELSTIGQRGGIGGARSGRGA